jgi:hypothetical protein
MESTVALIIEGEPLPLLYCVNSQLCLSEAKLLTLKDGLVDWQGLGFLMASEVLMGGRLGPSCPQ